MKKSFAAMCVFLCVIAMFTVCCKIADAKPKVAKVEEKAPVEVEAAKAPYVEASVPTHPHGGFTTPAYQPIVSTIISTQMSIVDGDTYYIEYAYSPMFAVMPATWPNAVPHYLAKVSVYTMTNINGAVLLTPKFTYDGYYVPGGCFCSNPVDRIKDFLNKGVTKNAEKMDTK